MSVIRKRFVMHEHHARNLHFDLRLEVDGVFRSWAVPKGPSLDPADKRLAMAVPDHSIAYGSFDGRLPDGSYGAGEIRIWDDGKYETAIDPAIQLKKGKLRLEFFGLKLRGEFVLTKMHGRKDHWLLIKSADHFADPAWRLETILPPRLKGKK